MPTVFEASATSEPRGHGRKKSAKQPSPMSGIRTRLGPLTSYAAHPNGVRFETQETEETVVLFLRQHIVVNIPWIVLTFFLLIAPTIVFPLLWNALNVSFPIPTGYIIIGTVFWYLGTFGFALEKFLGWFFNIYIVTNERVVDIDFHNLLYKQFSQAELARIQDLSYTSGGIFAATFNYGNVAIQTAGEMPNLEFDRVPYPEKIVGVIRSLTEEGSKKTV